MANAVFGVIGVLSGALGIVGFFQDNLPQRDTQSANLRIAVGLSGNGLVGPGGDIPVVYSLNANKDLIGVGGNRGGSIPDGGFHDLMLTQGLLGHGVSQQVPWLEMEGVKNGICIAYLTTTWADGQQWGFIGDWFETCGSPWYNSQIRQDNKILKCGWLEKNSPIPDAPEKITLFLPIFKADSNSGGSPSDAMKKVCNTENFVIKRPGRKMKKRTIYRDPNDTRFVMSSGTENAKELCASATSYGPDQMDDTHFCDMETKTLWPLCDSNITEECFNAEAKEVNTKLAKREKKPYGQTLDWRSS